jgi:hypothetical protein
MARASPARQRKDLKASLDAIKKSYFWEQYTAALRRRHDMSLLIVRTKADGSEAELRVAAAMSSAFHTALNLPELLITGAEPLTQQEDEEQIDDHDPDQ